MADEIETRQRTEETRQRFAAEVEALAQAVRRHGATVLALTGRPDEPPQIFAAGAELPRVAGAYAAAQFEYAGTFPPFDVEPEDCSPGETDRDRMLYRFDQALGSIDDTAHEWGDDPAEWVRRQRSGG